MYYITKEIFDKYKKAKKANEKEVVVSLDLGITLTKTPVAYLETVFEQIKRIKKQDIFIVDKKDVFKPLISSDAVYKLALDENNYPALFIDGVKMNTGKDLGIEEYNKQVVSNLQIKKLDNVLEICTGLGYKTILMSKKAKFVKTIEKSKDVIELAKINPYSKELFNGRNIDIIYADAFDRIKTFAKNSFSRILHDPPTFKFAPKLYTEEFYEELYRVAKPNSILFHYTGAPGSKSKKTDLVRTTAEKLTNAGWKVTKKENLGIYAIKE